MFFIGLRSLELPEDGHIMCPKHVGAVNSKYFCNALNVKDCV